MGALTPLPMLAAIFLGLMGSLLPVRAQVEHTYPPVALTPGQEARLQAMLPNLRCLVCQNESLAASQAPLARDLRYKIRLMLANGDSDSQIKSYLVARYGEYVLYKPRFEPRTWLLWLGPFLLVALGLILAIRVIVRRRASVTPESTVDREALQRLLDENH